MTITFFSNFLNHHQLPFSLEMVRILGDDYKFVATERIPEERTNLGYEDMNSKYDFVIRSYEDEETAYRLGLESDVIIIGSAPQKYIKERLKQGKLTIRYSERLFKNSLNSFKVIPNVIRFALYEKRNTFLLCSSAYSAYDFNKVGLYKNKCYKWGYFPEIKEYKNIEEIINSKNDNSILWVGRFISWKHPEYVIQIAKKLKENKYNFNIKMIGIGAELDNIEKMIKNNKLEDCIQLLGSMSPNSVREYMEKSKIFLFTSDRGEGWGAVLNEAMNSACAVVASHEIGSVPFLIKNEENGLIYEDGNIECLYSKVQSLLDSQNRCRELGYEAYNTMITQWNPKLAAKRILELSKSLLGGNDFNKYKDGPCSKAYIIKDKIERKNGYEENIK